MLDLNLGDIQLLLTAVNDRILKLQNLHRGTLVTMGTMMDSISSLDDMVHHLKVCTARRNLLVQAMQLRNKLQAQSNVYNQIADTVKGVSNDYPGYKSVYRPDDDDLPF